MKLTYEETRWVLESDYEERHTPKNAGFRWDPSGRQWWTDDPMKATSLAVYADETAIAEIKKASSKIGEAVAESKSVSADFTVPAPAGKKYMPFQLAGIRYASTREAVLMGDEMGLGKTIQAIGTINADVCIEKVLVICPASLKINWKREMESWLVRPMEVEVIGSTGTWPKNQGASVEVVNYDILKKYSSEIRETEYDLLIVDECHYLKNAKTQRAKQVFGHWDARSKKYSISPIRTKKKIFLTGTPIVNRPSELYGVASYLAPKTFGNFWSYMKRYADAHRGAYGWDMSGASNLEELQQKLRASIMVRRLKKDVLTELPPKIRQVIELPINGFSKIVDRENSRLQKQTDILAELQLAVDFAEASEDEEKYREAIKRLKAGYIIQFAEMAKIRHETAVKKIPLLVAHIQSVLEETEKVVVFAHHHDVIHGALEALRGDGVGAVGLTGEDSLRSRQEAVDNFQADPECRVFVGSIQAAGVGLTLTAASHVIFAELDWVPGNVSQAEDRCHRIGQTDSVLIQHLVLEGSIDAQMANKIIEKQEVIDQALDISPEASTIPIVPHTPTPKRAAGVLPPSQIEAIHQALRQLAGVCDGASMEDGQGYNKVDARVGQSLASEQSLTPKQAALGQKILLKYHRQLGETLVAAISPTTPMEAK